MKKSIIKTIYTLTATIGLSLVAIANASAWGPQRTTFTMESPASYPTFNSITNNPSIGDERDFVRVGEVNADVTNLSNEITVVPGRQYLVYIYFHNNASATYNDKAHNNAGVAFKTRLSSAFSQVITPSSRGTITGTITAENSKPTSVWDEAYMKTNSEKVILRYIAGSAKIYNDWKANGSIMPSSLFTDEGTLLGLNELNGIIPGCEEYHGVVTYVLQAEALSGSVEKTVSKDGKNYSENVTIAPGEEAYFKIAIKNTGDIALTNVVIKDTLPSGLTLVSGSVELSANSSTTREKLSDNITKNGYNLGTIGTGNTVYIYYRAKAGDNFDCNGSTVKNNVTLTYDSESTSGDTKKDDASVTVKKTKDCSKDEDPIPVVPDPEPEPEPEPTPTPEPTPDTPAKIVDTGPVEIVLAIIIVLSIGVGAFYYYRTHKTLKIVKGEVSGKDKK